MTSSLPPGRWRRRSAWALAALAVLVPVTWGCLRLDTRTPALVSSTSAPAFELLDARGRTVRLDDLRRDGPVVVVFYRGHW